MAENVILSVQLSGAESALSQLTQLDNVLKSIKGNRNVKINVKANGLSSAAESAKELGTSLEKVNQSAKKTGTDGAKNIENAGKSLKGASQNAESFNTGLGNVLVTMAKFRLVSAAINLVAGAFKSAFEEMKNVDTELVNIRKVTGFTKTEIDGLTKSAYSLATAYGRGASEVLKASTVFARAGYTDQIEQLSELSLLLQNVGDLQADEASKFIIATDKAYKLGGSYDELIKVIDGLDNITNKNATDMQKMTEGMTVAGSVFAESGESIEVFAALLGTATANTQRSGAEVARGLRTILMNLRQIRGETEDGELIDGESIAQAATALKEYAGISTMENGQLRKASDVLAELASKWDTLSETQRAAIAEAVAGKRQANILMTLMGDWDSVEKMMQEYETGAGTAAKENAIYMESWAAKIEQVKAAWNELVAAIVDSDIVKTFLNGVYLALEDLNYLLSSSLERAEKDAKKAEEKAKQTRDSFEKDFGAGSRYDELISNIENLTDAEKVELGILIQQRQERERLLQLVGEEAKKAAERVEAEKQKKIDERNSEAAIQNKGLAIGIAGANEIFAESKDADIYADQIAKIVNLYKDYYIQLMAAKAAGQELTEQEQQFIESYDVLAKAATEGGNAVEVYGKLTAAAAHASGEEWETAADKANEAMSELAKTIKDIPVVKSITVKVTTEGMSGFISQVLSGKNVSGFASGTKHAPGGPALVNENGPEIISANGLAWIAGGGKPTVTMLPRGATVLTASQTKNAIKGHFSNGIPAYEDGTERANELAGELAGAISRIASNGHFSGGNTTYQVFTGSDFVVEHPDTGTPKGRQVHVVGEAIWGTDEDGNPVYQRGPTKYSKSSKIYDPSTGKNIGSGGVGSSYGGGVVDTTPNFKALEDDLSKLLKNLDAQAKLAENEEDYLKAMMVYGEAQSAIADLLEQYRANGYADDSDEVLRLANLGYDYAAKQLGGYDKLQQNLIDALNALTQSTDNANELEEKRQAVENARQALANAERQRTVRVFNPVTGQWEWVANAADVTKAQENLKNAEEALRKEELNQAVNAIKNAKPEDLGDMTLSPAILEALFGGTQEQQTAFLNALGAASGGANWLASSEAQTAWNQGNNIGTQYNLNGITLTEAQASGMTIKELIATLQGLKIM